MVQTIPNNAQLMNPRDFCMWLHGFFEIAGTNKLTEKQVEMVKTHLDLMFKQPMVSFATTSDEMSALSPLTSGPISGAPEIFIC